jgi:hypothetical protein
MTKQPTRLADFAIPRNEDAPADAAPAASSPLAGRPAMAADAVPVRIAPRPVAEARQAMTIRLPVSMHERIRLLMFTSRRSQQDIVEAALESFLTANQT